MKNELVFKSDKISNDKGDYIVLADNGIEGQVVNAGIEGLIVTYQTDCLEDALLHMTQFGTGTPQTLVRLVRVEFEECI